MGIGLLLICIGHFFVDVCVGIWPLYKTIAGIDLKVAGTIAGVSGFIGEAMQMFFGYFSDRGWRKHILLLGIGCAATIFFISLFQTVPFYFLIILMVMLGSGAFHPAAVGFVGSLSGTQKGKLILCFAFAGALGQGASQLFYISFFAGHQERIFMILLVMVLIAFAIIRYRFKTAPASREKLTLAQFLEPFRTRKKPLLLLYFSQVASQGLLLAFIFLLPDLLREKGCDSWLCHGGGQLCFLFGAASMMIPVGILSDRLGPRKVMISAAFMSIILFYTLLYIPALSMQVTAGLLALFGIFSWVINPLIVAWGNRLVPESPSFVSGLLMGMAWCFSHLTTILSGHLVHYFPTHPCRLALSVLGVLLILTLSFAIAMPQEEKQPVIA